MSVLDRVVREISEKLKATSDAITDGQANDFAEYKFMAGKAQALKDLAHFITEERQRADENTEDQE